MEQDSGDFLENNYKTQTISLVRKRFKLIWFLAIRVQKTRFVAWYTGQKSSPLDSVSKQRNQIYWTRISFMQTEPNGLDLVMQWATQTERRRKKQQRVQNEEERSNEWKPGADSNQTQPTKASGDAKGRDRTCLAAATMQKRWSFRRRDDAKTMKLQAPGFGQNRRLGFIRCFFLLHFELSPLLLFFVLWIFWAERRVRFT